MFNISILKRSLLLEEYILPDVFMALLPISRLIYKSFSDDNLMLKISQGDQNAFNALFERYAALIVGYATRFLNQRERAEEVTQEIWIQIIRKANDYKAENKFRAWILTLTRNACLKEIRSTEDNVAWAEEDTPNASTVDTVTPESILSLSDNKKLLKQYLSKLPDQQRLILLVRLTEELNYEDIGRIFKISESSVKSTLFRAKRNLEEAIKKGDLI